MKGEIVYFYVYDVGAELNLERIERVLDRRAQMLRISCVKAIPRHIELPKPLIVRFPPVILDTNLGRIRFSICAKFFGLGAVSISLRCKIPDLKDVPLYDNIKIISERKEMDMAGYVGEMYKRIIENIKESMEEEYGPTSGPVEHTVICITESDIPVKELLGPRRKELAALLQGITDPERLSNEEVDDVLKYWYSYYNDDLVVIDWDKAIVIEPSGRYEDALFIIETANMQLVELMAYDNYLSRVLEGAYGDVEKFRRRIWYSPREIISELSDVQMDLTDMMDKLANTTKFFGDWYLAKIYMACSKKLHLDEWYRIVREKLDSLSRLYNVANEENNSRRMLMLEAMIVLLFIIDVVLLILWR